MKRYFGLILLALVLAIGSYTITRDLAARGEEDQATWLKREFELSDAQAATIAKLQADYQPVCMEHCRLIREAHERLAAAPADTTVKTEVVRLEGICTAATLAHLREVAARMTPAEGQRFLALVEPRVSRHEHQGPLGLR